MSDTSCIGTDWDPIASAETYSAFAAVLAGFVFVCVVNLATDHQKRGRANTLTLFLAAFFCLAAASYSEAVSAGEVVCLRGWTAAMFSSGLLGAGAGAMFCGLAWLFSDYTDSAGHMGQTELVRRFTMVCTYCAVGIVALMLMVTAEGYLFAVATADPVPRWLGLAVWVYPVLALVAIAVVGAVRRVRPVPIGTTPVVVAAVAVLAFAVTTMVILAVVTRQPASAWQSVPVWVMVISTLFPLISSSIVLLLLLDALPRAAANSLHYHRRPHIGGLLVLWSVRYLFWFRLLTMLRKPSLTATDTELPKTTAKESLPMRVDHFRVTTLYSQLAGVLAGFAFTTLSIFFARDQLPPRAGSVAVALFSAFGALVIFAILYAMLSGEVSDNRAAAGLLIYGLPFGISIITLFYTVILMASNWPELASTVHLGRVLVIIIGPTVVMSRLSNAAFNLTEVAGGRITPFRLGNTLTILLCIATVVAFLFSRSLAAAGLADYDAAVAFVSLVLTVATALISLMLSSQPAHYRPSRSLVNGYLLISSLVLIGFSAVASAVLTLND